LGIFKQAFEPAIYNLLILAKLFRNILGLFKRALKNAPCHSDPAAAGEESLVYYRIAKH
jgi:hypothetical protein